MNKMLRINKITSSPVVDYAAEELKKYLRMMMPDAGEIVIKYAPEATEGFRLGLMADFGIDTSEADDLTLDDIVHIDTDCEGGIIAGSNVRSVLLAVYKYLTINGCRWLFPGIDGEFIPVKNIAPTVYHKMADNRFRGQCNEGAESQQCMIETIDFAPKIGMNVYMIEFDIPKAYYDFYYNHRGNPNREPEPVTESTVLQWKRVCEAEISKRGLQFHDMGHGWTAESFGISSIGGWARDDSNPVPEKNREYIALMNGKRELCGGVALNTNFCMSNPEARAIVTKCVCDYAEKSTNVDYLHVWLADSQKNHCECDECRRMIPSDWYARLLNEIDEELTRRTLNTRIVFCEYSDTTWAPEKIKIKNPKRFSMLMGAISRSYTYSVGKEPPSEKTPFVLNVTGRIGTLEEYLLHAREWRKMADCPSFVYEYHFWKHQFYAPGLLSFARRIFEDIECFKENGFNGIIEDGSQRSFFPNGLSWYVYANKLFDSSLSFDELVSDYFSHAYGKAAERVRELFERLDECMPQSYIEYKHSVANDKEVFSPAMAEKLRGATAVCDELASLANEHKNMPYRVQTVAMRLLSRYSEFCRGLSKPLVLRAIGAEHEAKESFIQFVRAFGKYETELERYYDQSMMWGAYKPVFNLRVDLVQ